MDLKEYLMPTSKCKKYNNHIHDNLILSWIYQKLKHNQKQNYFYKYTSQIREAIEDEIDPIAPTYMAEIFKLCKLKTSAINLTTLLLEELSINIESSSYLYTKSLDDCIVEASPESFETGELYNSFILEIESLIEAGYETLIDTDNEVLTEYLIDGFSSQELKYKLLSPCALAVKEYMPRGSECFIEVTGDNVDEVSTAWIECGGYPQTDSFYTKNNKYIEYWTFSEYEDQQDYFCAADFLTSLIKYDLILYDEDNSISEEVIVDNNAINVFFDSLELIETKEVLF